MLSPTVRYDSLKPASENASDAARGASKKRDNKPELMLRQAIRAQGLRGYRVDPSAIPGRPDVAFLRERVAVFCDGDFWHGRNLEERIVKLAKGHNALYWIEKIRGNVARDRRWNTELEAQGWEVLRFWETDVKKDPAAAAAKISAAIKARRRTG